MILLQMYWQTKPGRVIRIDLVVWNVGLWQIATVVGLWQMLVGLWQIGNPPLETVGCSDEPQPQQYSDEPTDSLLRCNHTALCRLHFITFPELEWKRCVQASQLFPKPHKIVMAGITGQQISSWFTQCKPIL